MVLDINDFLYFCPSIAIAPVALQIRNLSRIGINRLPCCGKKHSASAFEMSHFDTVKPTFISNSWSCLQGFAFIVEIHNTEVPLKFTKFNGRRRRH
jgi:hypothetical protein